MTGPNLADLVADPRRVAEASSVEVAAMLAQLGGLVVMLSARLAVPAESEPSANGGELIGVPEACRLLGCEAPWLWRRARRLDMRGLVVKLSRKRMMFRRRGLEAWITKQAAR